MTGAADDRTFVLDSVQLAPAARSGILVGVTQPRTWYLLRITPGATPVQTLTPLHFPVPDGADINGVALSPDGTKLAVFYQVARNGDGFPYSGPFTLGIYSVATGAVVRSWTGTDPSHGSYAYAWDGPPDPNANLTWTSDGQRLAFAYGNSKGPNDQPVPQGSEPGRPGRRPVHRQHGGRDDRGLDDQRQVQVSGASPSASPATGGAPSAARSCLRPRRSAPRSTR